MACIEGITNELKTYPFTPTGGPFGPPAVAWRLLFLPGWREVLELAAGVDDVGHVLDQKVLRSVALADCDLRDDAALDGWLSIDQCDNRDFVCSF